jgi:hypothetical protein
MKKLLIISLFLCSALFLPKALLFSASDESTQFYTIDDFSKGLNSHASNLITPKNQGVVAQNVRINNEYGSLSKAEPLISYGTLGASKVTGLYRYYKSDDTSYLLASSGSTLSVGEDSTGVFTTLKDSLTDGKRWQFVTYKDICIGMNGYDNPLKFDGNIATTENVNGARTLNNSLAELGSPFAELLNGSHLDSNSWYQYKVAFYDGSDYYYSTARSNPIKTGYSDIFDYSASAHVVGDMEMSSDCVGTDKVFGTGSCPFNGTSDYLTVAGSTDFNFGTGNFTIEAWVKFDTIASADVHNAIATRYQDANNYWIFSAYSNNDFYFFGKVASSAFSCSSFGVPTLVNDTWYHIALVRSGTEVSVYLNGTKHTSPTANSANLNMTADVLIGGLATSYFLDGSIDELRISNIARWTSSFTVPTSAYSADSNTKLLLHLDVGCSDLKLTDIPLGEEGTTRRYIYRTLGNSSRTNVLADTTYYKVATILDNTTRTYSDLSTDTVISVNAAPTWATVSAGGLDVTPPKGSYCNIHGERLFIAGNKTYNSDIYWSDLFNPDYFLATSFEQIRPDDGDKITFIKSLLGILTIGKTNSIQKFYTDGDVVSAWYCSAPFSNNGCPAPYSVANSPLGIIYLGRYGLFVFNGQSSTLLSDPITKEIRDIQQASIADTFGIYWNNEYHLAYTSDASGESENNRILVYDAIRESFTLDLRYANCMATLQSGLDFGNLYYGTNDGKVVKEGSTTEYLSKRYSSDFDAGTYDDVRQFGTEESPLLKIAWDLTGDAAWRESGYPVAGDMASSGGTHYLGDREDLGGQWRSPVYKIDASALSKLYWNEDLNEFGDVQFRTRTASTEAGITSAAWSAAVSDPSGSAITSTANDYIQIEADLSTSNILYTPELYSEGNYVWRLAYSKSGSPYETTLSSIWKSGLFEPIPNYQTLIKWIKVYYEASEGTLNINYKNNEGTVDETFTIDFTKNVYEKTSHGDTYEILETDKVFTYRARPNDIGSRWQLTVSDNGITSWKIKKIEIAYQPVDLSL